MLSIDLDTKGQNIPAKSIPGSHQVSLRNLFLLVAYADTKPPDL